MLKTITTLIKDESGASAAEYALILAIVGSAIAASALYLGNQIAQAMEGAGNVVCNPAAGGVDLCTK